MFTKTFAIHMFIETFPIPKSIYKHLLYGVALFIRGIVWLYVYLNTIKYTTVQVGDITRLQRVIWTDRFTHEYLHLPFEQAVLFL